MAKKITTIKVSKNTANKLKKLKVHPRQSYEEVIVKLLNNAELGDKPDEG